MELPRQLPRNEAVKLFEDIDKNYWENSLPYVRLKVRDTEFLLSIPNNKAEWVAQTVQSREPEVYEWIDSNLSQDSLLIDVGSNFGLYSIYAAKKIGCKVIAFEPHFASYYICFRNVIVNNLSDYISLYPVAVTNSSSMQTMLRLHDLSAGKALNTLSNNTSVSDNFQINQDITKMSESTYTSLCQPFSQPVISVSIDSFIEAALDESHVKQYDNIALKVDVDGLDFLVITGALKSLQIINKIIIEYLPDQVSMHKLIPPLTKQYGFKVVNRTKVNLILERS